MLRKSLGKIYDTWYMLLSIFPTTSKFLHNHMQRFYGNCQTLTNVCMFKIMHMPIKVGICTYTTYTKWMNLDQLGKHIICFRCVTYLIFVLRASPIWTIKNFLAVREHQQKTFSKLSRFWLLREWGSWVNLVKEENSLQKSFFR